MTEQERLLKLRDELEKHRYAYHVLDRPTISDEAYDTMMTELVSLEAKYPSMYDKNSPSQRVGGEVIDSFKKVKHATRQWSFDNVFNFEELSNWEERNLTILNKSNISIKPSYVCEFKIDGLKLVLTYKSGELVQAATRGDGEVGEDVTHNVRTIKSVPLKLNKSVDIIVIGECFIKKSDFEKFNQKLKEGEEKYANPRNLAAGTLRQLDSSAASSRKLHYFAYDIDMYSLDLPPTQIEELELLKDLGFMVNSESKYARGIKEVQDIYDTWKEIRGNFEFGVDGMVVKVNEREIFESLGYTAKSPRAGIAYKFPAEQATSVIESIVCQVGRTGAITPVANLSPVLIAGSTVSRATLHNPDEIQRLDVRVGDTVILQKAGDIIPEVLEVVLSLRPKGSHAFEMPTNCPTCNSKLQKLDGSVALYCLNPDCNAKHLESLVHFVSKKGMNIEGLGEKIIYEFAELGLITDAASIYELKVSDIEGLFGYGKKSAENIINSIQGSKVVELDNFIYSLGIRHIGETTAKELAKYFKSFTALRDASLEQLLQTPNIGEESAKSLVAFFNNAKSKKLVDDLLSYIKVNKVKNINISQALEGKTFVITGSFEISRDIIKNEIESHGGKVSSSVSGKTSYLLCGQDPGSKLDDATRLGVKVINFEDYQKML